MNACEPSPSRCFWTLREVTYPPRRPPVLSHERTLASAPTRVKVTGGSRYCATRQEPEDPIFWGWESQEPGGSRVQGCENMEPGGYLNGRGTVCRKWVPVLFWGCKQTLRHSRFACGDCTLLLSLSLSLSLSFWLQFSSLEILLDMVFLLHLLLQMCMRWDRFFFFFFFILTTARR